jgi:hypothetical protein
LLLLSDEACARPAGQEAGWRSWRRQDVSRADAVRFILPRTSKQRLASICALLLAVACRESIKEFVLDEGGGGAPAAAAAEEADESLVMPRMVGHNDADEEYD